MAGKAALSPMGGDEKELKEKRREARAEVAAAAAADRKNQARIWLHCCIAAWTRGIGSPCHAAQHV